MKKIILLAMLLSASVLVSAQDDGKMDEGYAPKAGDFTFSMLYGRSNIMNQGLTLPQAPGIAGTAWIINNNSPYANQISLVDNNFTNMVGIETRYYVSDRIATTLSGTVRMDHTPGQVNIPGVITQGSPNASWIPALASIPEQNSTLLNVNIGAQYLFNTKVSRVFPYIGVTVPFYYALMSEYDPTINDNVTSSTNSSLIVDIGTRSAEIFGFGFQIAGGIDYYLMDGFYFGFEIRPASWVYAYSASKAGPGLEIQQAGTNTFSFFTQPFMKLGFKF
jgi:outer membrane protein W